LPTKLIFISNFSQHKKLENRGNLCWNEKIELRDLKDTKEIDVYELV